MKRKNSIIKIVLVLLIVAVVPALYLVRTKASPVDCSTTTERGKLQSLLSFVDRYQGKVSAVQCSDGAKFEVAEVMQGTKPTAWWAAKAWIQSSLLLPEYNYRAKAIELGESLPTNETSLAFYTALFPLQEIAFKTSEPTLLKQFHLYALRLRDHTRTSLVSLNAHVLHPMHRATIAYVLSKAATLYVDPQVNREEVLSRITSQEIRESERLLFIETATHLMANYPSQKPGGPENMLEDSLGCFGLMAWSAIAEATSAEAQREAIRKEFKRSGFFSASLADLSKRFTLTQNLLPCFEATLLISKSPKEWTDMVAPLLDQLVLQVQQDDSCSAQGSVGAKIGASKTKESLHTVADASWLASLLAQYINHKEGTCQY